MIRGKLKAGFYIANKKEKIYLSQIKNGKVIYGGKAGKGAKKFPTNDEAYDFLDKHDLRKENKVISVR
ncbi:hypothetical protein [Vagococcus fluvialis]|uniref:hypothetical protein n=1 Tax=Vagococcus fluvialis TaxID=2738 RepID=UPI001D0A5CF9|nr:hypothetical protein [Vagococcus fluvialis]UDM72627.1 hypothetical protein K5L00_14665 [Vagococcus fluvialis]UDM78350.1 hypothetical protein K5K98_14870 [Vagococcus fluvialis]UDM83902.1 hypothetical protein K5K96_14690 [Vagococcus fluvialis]